MKNMNVLRSRDIRRLLLWPTSRHHRSLSLSLSAHKRINDGRNSSFNESLLTGKLSDERWPNVDSEKVPRGFLPVYVGLNERRFVIPTVYLSMPEFRNLMEMVAEEYDFEQEGGLKIPCEEEDFEEVLFRCMANHRTMSKGRRRK